MNDGRREKLPQNRKFTCDKTPWGWSSDAHNTERCGKKTVVFVHMTCACGKCDMSYSLCKKHENTL